MKRVLAAVILAALLTAWGCASAPRPYDSDYSTHDKFEREKATSSATPF